MKIETGKSYEVKQWFADKIATEVGRNIHACDVFCVLKETEKAVYAMLYLGYITEDHAMRKTCWIPKAALIERDAGADELQVIRRPVLIETDYNEAVKQFELAF